jgi:hypothetical protein
MRFQLIPNKQGQICRLIDKSSRVNDDVYILVGTAEDIATAIFVELNDLQRHTSNPALTEKLILPVAGFTVIADSLEKYIGSWNNEAPPDSLKAYAMLDADDVKQFFYDLHQMLSVEFYPDDDFCLLTTEDDSTIFTEAQGQYLNRVMTNCFDLCDRLGIDIYDLAGEVQINVFRNRGIWPT